MSSDAKRFQIDLTEEELRSIDRLGSLAGLSTKKEAVLNAIALLRWASREIMYGRTICSINPVSGDRKEIELAVLSTIARKQVEYLSDQEAVAAIVEGGQSATEMLSSLKT